METTNSTPKTLNVDKDPSLASVAASPELLARALVTLLGAPDAAVDLLQGALDYLPSSKRLSSMASNGEDMGTEVSAFAEEEDMSLEQLQIIKTKTLMDVIRPAAKELIINEIVADSSVIDWGKIMARPNEIIQKDILKSLNIKAYDPEKDPDCPQIDTTNNSPGFDIIVKSTDNKLYRIQSKLRQVKGKTNFSQQIHFETTRRHSKKNEGTASDSGHVAYSCDEFDYVMVTLINVGNDGKNRNNVDKWSFSLIPVEDIIDKKKGCCLTKIPSDILRKHEFNPNNPPQNILDILL